MMSEVESRALRTLAIKAALRCVTTDEETDAVVVTSEPRVTDRSIQPHSYDITFTEEANRRTNITIISDTPPPPPLVNDILAGEINNFTSGSNHNKNIMQTCTRHELNKLVFGTESFKDVKVRGGGYILWDKIC